MEDMKSTLPPLSKRLAAAVSFVKKGCRVADVGCDHGYTAVYLKNSGISPFCICTDVNKGPLEAASENIRKFGASDIETRLCDGLSGVLPGEADCIIITGMGGELICRILEDGKETVKEAEELVTGPQSEPEKVREKIYELGFQIEDEALVFEDGKYYPIIKAVKRGSNGVHKEEGCGDDVSGEIEGYGGNEPGEIEGYGNNRSGKAEKYADDIRSNEAEMMFGPKLLAKRDSGLRAFLDKEEKRHKSILEHLTDADERTTEISNRENEIRHILALTEKAQGYYK